MRKNSTRQKGKKKFNFQQYQSFEHNSMKMYDQQRLESLEDKKGHADTVAERFANLKAKGGRLANSRDVNPLKTTWSTV